MLYNSFLQDLNSNNIDYTIVGSHALYILNKKHNLNFNIDLTKKDLDILIPLSDAEYFKNLYFNKYNFNKVNKHSNGAILNSFIYENKNSKIDIIIGIRKNFVFTANNLVLNFDYHSLINYRFEDILYKNKVNCINLDIYYAIIKRTGLKKYKNILNSLKKHFIIQ